MKGRTSWLEEEGGRKENETIGYNVRAIFAVKAMSKENTFTRELEKKEEMIAQL